MCGREKRLERPISRFIHVSKAGPFSLYPFPSQYAYIHSSLQTNPLLPLFPHPICAYTNTYTAHFSLTPSSPFILIPYIHTQYFPEVIDNRKTLLPNELTFTIKALQATRKELDEYLKGFPSDVVNQLMQELGA